MQSSGSTALRWWLAVELRRLREDADLARPQAADQVGVKAAQVGHWETSERLPNPLQLEKLTRIYGVPERFDLLRRLRAHALRGEDWWIGLAQSVPERFQLYLGLESTAPEIHSFDRNVVPGLLQTDRYAEAVIRAGRSTLSDAELQERVALRMARKRHTLESKRPPKVSVVLSEAALRWRIGGTDVLREQLTYLEKLARLDIAEIRVLPFASGAYPAAEGTFTILSAPSEIRGIAGVVYVETLVRGDYFDQPQDVAAYSEALTRLQTQALDPLASRHLIVSATAALGATDAAR